MFYDNCFGYDDVLMSDIMKICINAVNLMICTPETNVHVSNNVFTIAVMNATAWKFWLAICWLTKDGWCQKPQRSNINVAQSKWLVSKNSFLVFFLNLSFLHTFQCPFIPKFTIVQLTHPSIKKIWWCQHIF